MWLPQEFTVYTVQYYNINGISHTQYQSLLTAIDILHGTGLETSLPRVITTYIG